MPVWEITHVNYLAVVVAAIAMFLVGGIWYGAVFGRAWVGIHGYTPEQTKSMQKGAGKVYGMFLLTDLVRAWVTVLCLNAFHVTSVAGGICAATTLWLGYAATFHFENYAAHRKPIMAFALDAGYQILASATGGAILAAWR
ncbi:MAG: DUF1761 domain-containing protein [Planctomycetes bacterium]|nr:DUF1761 domain-containing protein [Planctomycetota bacterium]